MSTRLLPDPENRRHDICFPRVSHRTPRLRRLSRERLAFDTFRLSSQAGIERDEEREEKRGNSAAFSHQLSNEFPFKHCAKREGLLHVSRTNYRFTAGD
jgi:hypothetical protein